MAKNKINILNDVVKCVYNMEEISIVINGKKETMEENRFLSFVVINSFTNNIVPYAEINLALLDTEMNRVYKAKECKIHLIISEILYDADDQLIAKSVWMNRQFDVNINLEDFIPDIGLKKKSVNDLDEMNICTFSLYSKEDLNFFRLKKDAIYHNINPISVLNNILLDRGLGKVVIATPPANNAIIKSCALPLGDMISNIEHLIKNYGLYTSSPIIYKDFENLMIIDIPRNPIEVGGKDLPTVEIIEHDDKESGVYAFPFIKMKRGDNSYKLLYEKIFRMKEDKDIMDRIDTPNIISVDEKGNVSTKIVNKNVSNVKLIRKTNSLVHSMKDKTVLNPESYNMIFRLTPYYIFKPYRRFVIVTESERINLNLLSHTFLLDSTTRVNGGLVPINEVDLYRF